jgi:hypothetical protein
VFPVRYELNSYTLHKVNSDTKGLILVLSTVVSASTLGYCISATMEGHRQSITALIPDGDVEPSFILMQWRVMCA